MLQVRIEAHVTQGRAGKVADHPLDSGVDMNRIGSVPAGQYDLERDFLSQASRGGQ